MRRISIEAVRRKYTRQLMRLPNVTGIGAGEKAGEKVIKVFVTRKVPEAALQPQEIIPATRDGYGTDVEAAGDLPEPA